MTEKRYKFFRTEQASVADPATGKPYYFVVNNRSGDDIGVIAWYRAWKMYGLKSEDCAVWSADCLADIIEFLNELNKENKA